MKKNMANCKTEIHDIFTPDERKVIEEFAEWQSTGYEWDAYPDHCYFLGKENYKPYVVKYNFRTNEEVYTKKFKSIEKLIRYFKIKL